MRYNVFSPLLGNGIFTQDGKQWEHSRAIMRPQFAREQVGDLDLEERHVQHMMTALDAHMKSDGWTSEIDLQVLFFRLTLDTATEFLFGESVDSQVRLQPRFKPSREGAMAAAFADAFDVGQRGITIRARLGNLYWLANGKEFRDACKVCNTFIDRFVQRALSKDVREKEPELHSSGRESTCFLRSLLARRKTLLSFALSCSISF